MRNAFRNYFFMGILMALVIAGDSWRLSGAGNSNHAGLSGHVRSDRGEPLAGIPVQAQLQGKNISVVVYTNKDGLYSFRDLPPGLHTLSVAVGGYQRLRKESVEVKGQQPAQADLTLLLSPPSIHEMTSSEILLALPGTTEEKSFFSECSNCHSLEYALQKKRDRAGWMAIIRKMRGITPSGAMMAKEIIEETLAETKDKNERLADFLVSIRGPESGDLPYKLLPRPVDDASTSAVITEYHIARGAVSATLRGDPRGAWVHDLMLEPKTGYLWYTDHFASILSRLDPKSGEIKEYPFPHAKPGKQDGGFSLAFDRDGNILVGVLWQGTIARFDPKTEKFTEWTIEEDARLGSVMPDASGMVWSSSSPTNGIYSLDPATGKFIKYTVPTHNSGIYGTAFDSKGGIYFCEMGAAKVGRFDTKTKKFAEWAVPTPDSWPRRLDVDLQDRLWFGEFHGARIGMFDPKSEKIREWKLSDNPYAAPYTVAVDNKNKTVWTTDFNSNLIYRFDQKTERFTKFLMPEPNLETRFLLVDSSTTPATVWIPDYSPPGKILKLQAY